MLPEGAAQRISVQEKSNVRAWPLSMADMLCTAALLAVSSLALFRILGGGTLIGQDSATQFYPWYSYLGERLRDFDIPAWNPAQFSGVPFAADPQSGWTYLPAMLTFAALPLTMAVAAYLIFHILLAGIGAYALARLLGIGPIGALATGIAYELSGPVFSRSICCPAQLQVISWVPIVLIGIEMALDRRTWISRLKWISLAAFAISQIVASWLGQGSYYVALLAGGYLLYRGVIDPRGRERSWQDRWKLTLLTGAAIGVISAGFSAAGVLPRLEFNQLSNLAAGIYDDDHLAAAVSGGWQAGQTRFSELTSDPYYMGGIVIALATISVLLTRGRFATPFFFLLMVGSFVLSSDAETPAHRLAYLLLPRFEDLHRHWPERIGMVGFIGIAVLAGAAVDALPSWVGQRRRTIGLAAIPVGIASGFVIALRQADDMLPGVMIGGVVIVAGALLLTGSDRTRQAVPFLPAALVALLALDLLAANAGMIRNGPYGGFHEVDLQRYLQPSSAAQFLVTKQREEPFRYFGFDNRLAQMAGGWPVLYRYQFANDRTKTLVVNNRASLHGLQDIQGYNPVQMQAYVDFMNVLNSAPQDYHDANVLPTGLASPMLDLLNTRYVVIPADNGAGNDTLIQTLTREYPVVFDDGVVRVIERPGTLPRAWIVHDVVLAGGLEAMELVAAGRIDPRSTVAIDGVMPILRNAGNARESATIVKYEPERILLQTESVAAGMLVLSEVSYPAWKATVDGVPVRISTAYGLIRAIPLPAGSHTVEFTYDTSSEERGMGIAFATMALLGCTFAGSNLRRRYSSQSPS